MNKVARNNLRVKLGDLVSPHINASTSNMETGAYPAFDDSIEGLSGDIFDVYLKPCFLEGK